MIEATLIDHMGSDLSTVNAARVSFGKKSDWEFFYPKDESEWGDLEAFGWEPTDSSCLEWRKLPANDAKLIKYLAKHRHTSPFGHAFASFHCRSPLFVHAQLVKHKFLRMNTISRRYVDDEPEFYTPEVWRGRSADKKQGSDGVVIDHWITSDVDSANSAIKRMYEEMLIEGVAPEQARMVLPQSTMTEWYWSGSLDAFASMCRLRCASDTQYETRIVADQISAKMKELFPVSWAALMEGVE